MTHPRYVDDHGHKGSHTHDHVVLHNGHPHAHATSEVIHKEDPDHKPNTKHWVGGHARDSGFKQAADMLVGSVPHGVHTHIVHPRRDKQPEHHVPAGLMDQTPAPADNSGNHPPPKV